MFDRKQSIIVGQTQHWEHMLMMLCLEQEVGVMSDNTYQNGLFLFPLHKQSGNQIQLMLRVSLLSPSSDT